MLTSSPTRTPTLLALFGVRCGVMRQPPDQVLHEGQHTCVSLLPGFNRPDLQVQAVLWKSSGPNYHYLEPPIQHLLVQILHVPYCSQHMAAFQKKK